MTQSQSSVADPHILEQDRSILRWVRQLRGNL